MQKALLIGFICASLPLSACGGGSSGAEAGSATAAKQVSTGASESKPKTPREAQAATTSAYPIPDTPKPPKVSVPAGPPPTQIVVEDLRQGHGPTVTKHSWIAIHFVGLDYKTGKPFEIRWDRNSPSLRQVEYAFKSGSWERSLVGMQLGGRRKLIIPADLYKGGRAVVYVVDLLDVQQSGFTG